MRFLSCRFLILVASQVLTHCAAIQRGSLIFSTEADIWMFQNRNVADYTNMANMIFWRFFSRNQEIRDAILSLVHSYSQLDNKLERHEQRERSLGEQVKKGLITLQKNQRVFDTLKGTITRLDERVSSIETALISVSTFS